MAMLVRLALHSQRKWHREAAVKGTVGQLHTHSTRRTLLKTAAAVASFSALSFAAPVILSPARAESKGRIRQDIEFKASDGTILRGWHYVPEGRSGPVPTVVMAHGFSAVKEMYLDEFSEVFA